MRAPKHLAFVAFCAALKTSLGVVEKVGGRGRGHPTGPTPAADEGATPAERDRDRPPPG
jgi:hypothetical protein